MIKEIVIESKAFEEVITITSDTGIDIHKGVTHDIIERCKKESEPKLESFYLSDSDEESEEEVIEKHDYNSGCHCDICILLRSQEKEFDLKYIDIHSNGKKISSMSGESFSLIHDILKQREINYDW